MLSPLVGALFVPSKGVVMSDVDRRTVLKAGVWAVPVIAASVAVPAAVASTPPDLYCTTNDPDVESVRISGNVLIITFTTQARNSVDVTIRLAGHPEIHFNYVPQGTPTNGVPHMRNYRPGEVVTIDLPRAYSIDAGDWFQVKSLHPTDCIEVP